ncbi:hypothetical protein D3C71_952960 [compost metagenome]
MNVTVVLPAASVLADVPIMAEPFCDHVTSTPASGLLLVSTTVAVAWLVAVPLASAPEVTVSSLILARLTSATNSLSFDRLLPLTVAVTLIA